MVHPTVRKAPHFLTMRQGCSIKLFPSIPTILTTPAECKRHESRLHRPSVLLLRRFWYDLLLFCKDLIFFFPPSHQCSILFIDSERCCSYCREFWIDFVGCAGAQILFHCCIVCWVGVVCLCSILMRLCLFFLAWKLIFFWKCFELVAVF